MAHSYDDDLDPAEYEREFQRFFKSWIDNRRSDYHTRFSKMRDLHDRMAVLRDRLGDAPIPRPSFLQDPDNASPEYYAEQEAQARDAFERTRATIREKKRQIAEENALRRRREAAMAPPPPPPSAPAAPTARSETPPPSAPHLAPQSTPQAVEPAAEPDIDRTSAERLVFALEQFASGALAEMVQSGKVTLDPGQTLFDAQVNTVNDARRAMNDPRHADLAPRIQALLEKLGAA